MMLTLFLLTYIFKHPNTVETVIEVLFFFFGLKPLEGKILSPGAGKCPTAFNNLNQTLSRKSFIQQPAERKKPFIRYISFMVYTQ